MDSRPALLLIDFINTLDFDGGSSLAPRAMRAARNTQGLKVRALTDGIPVVYVNDNFGDWSGNFEAVVERCEASAHGRGLAALLRPARDDRSILKPRHSAFYGTPLEFLLDELKVDSLILTGLQAHICILFTAHDAFLRQYRLWVPSDCVASEREEDEEGALKHLAEVTRADIRPSTDLAGCQLPAAFGKGPLVQRTELQRIITSA